MVDEMDSSLTPNTHRFLCQLTEPVYRKLGWEPKPDESHNDSMLRPVIIRTLGMCGYQEVVDEAVKRVHCHYKLSGDAVHSLPADIRSAVYSIVLTYGDEGYLNKMMDVCSISLYLLDLIKTFPTAFKTNRYSRRTNANNGVFWIGSHCLTSPHSFVCI